MKTKLLACALSACFFLSALCSCGIAEKTTETTPPIYGADPAFPIIWVNTIDELLADLKTSEADIAEVINTNGTLYYSEAINKSFTIQSIIGGRTNISYYFYSPDTPTELGASFDVTFNYETQTLDDALEKVIESKHEYEIISENSFYDKTFGYIYFSHGDYVHSIGTDPSTCTERNWQNFIEIKSIDVTK